jgi:uncharacterized protein
MLLEFSVKNYRSFRDKVTLSMVASSDTKHLDTNTFEVTTPSKFRLLKSAAIYGANASGKTNLLRALGHMGAMVERSFIAAAREALTSTSPFRLDPATRTSPTEFEATFIAGDQRYVYGFTVEGGHIGEEWLTAARAARPRPLFRRRRDGSVQWGNSWRGGRAHIEAAMRDNALLLSVAAQFNNAVAGPPRDWFSQTLWEIDRPGDMEAHDVTVAAMRTFPQFEPLFLRLLATADLGIERVEIESVPVDATPEWQHASEQDRADMRASASLWTPSTVGMVRRGADGELHQFDLYEEESAGTRRLFDLAGHWLAAMLGGHVLIVDEFEAKLHPLIARRLLRMAHAAPTHPQLIFTTHDCNLLDADLLRRDQVWFTEKNQDGATDLYSLWDYKARKDENLRKGYLQGRYGAIPFVGEFSFGQDAEA